MPSYKNVLLVIDTNLYSGNFEREMCAHITGQTGDCGVGDDFIQGYEDIAEDMDMPLDKVMKIMAWFAEKIVQRSDEGCYRPCAIYPTEGRTNCGMGNHSDVTPNNPFKWPAYESVVIYLGTEPTKEIFDFIVARAKSFKYPSWKKSSTNPELEIKGVSILIEETVTTVSKTVDFSVKF